MGQPLKDWTEKQCRAAEPGRHRVSESLYLYVTPDRRMRRWIFRYTKPATGRVTEHGLGPMHVVSLAEVRAKVRKFQNMVREGEDPVEQRRTKRAETTTFASIAAEYIQVRGATWRGASSRKSAEVLFKHAEQLAQRPIADIGSEHIVTALRPLWLRAPNQARRAVGAIARVFDFAKAKGLCSGENPADWRGGMRHLFPAIKTAVKHHAALEYVKVPEFVRRLHIEQDKGGALSPSAIEFLLLTATRANEVCGMRWDEINFEEKVWTLPEHRTKQGAEHRVPLSARALELLARQRQYSNGAHVWVSRQGRAGKPIIIKAIYKYLTETLDMRVTIHGFRATFRTWAGNETHFDRVTCELALGHAAGDAVELAYRRGDALSKRRALMEAWATYCEGPQTP
jgi:integrase